MSLWLIAAASFFGLAVVLLVAGWRGKKIDDHPWCRKCRFDLVGCPETTESCPECGADLTSKRSFRIGQRRKRKAVLVTRLRARVELQRFSICCRRFQAISGRLGRSACTIASSAVAGVRCRVLGLFLGR